MSFTNRHILIFVLLALSACSRDEHVPVYDVNVEHDCPIESIISGKPEIIPLGADKGYFASAVSKVVLGDSTIYVLDRVQQTISSFDRITGQMVYCLDKKGRGPGEYVEISDFDVEGQRIAVLSRPSKKILIYSMTGELQKEYKTQNWYSYLNFINDTSIWVVGSCGTKKNQDVGIFDINSGRIKSLYNGVKETASVSISDHHYFGEKVGDSWLVSKIFDSTVYSLSDKGLNAEFRFDFHLPDGISKKELETKSIDKLSNEYRNRTHLRFLGGMEQRDSVFFAYASYTTTKHKLPMVAYSLIKVNINEGTVMQYRMAGFEKSPDGYPKFNAGQIVGYSDGTIIKYVVSGKLENSDNPELILYHVNF